MRTFDDFMVKTVVNEHGKFFRPVERHGEKWYLVCNEEDMPFHWGFDSLSDAYDALNKRIAEHEAK